MVVVEVIWPHAMAIFFSWTPCVCVCLSSSTPGSMREKHTFVNHIVAILEDMDKWNMDDAVTKEDMTRDLRTRLLQCMRAGLVHPFTTFYSLEASSVVSTGD